MTKCDPLKFTHFHVGFDLDGTLTPMNFSDLKEPFPWVKPIFKTLVDNGYVIWVYSARFNHDFYGNQAKIWFNECGEWLKQHDLYDYVILSPYKPPADIIFDDRGWALRGEKQYDVKSAINKLWIMSDRKIKWPKELLSLLEEK